MPWWAQLYLAVLAVMAVATLALEAHRGDSLPFLLGEVVSMTGLVLPYVAFWQPRLFGPGAWWLIALVVFSFGWETLTLDRNLDRQGLGGLARENPSFFFLTLLAGYALLSPAWACGVLAGLM